MNDDDYVEPEPCVNTDDPKKGWSGKHPPAVWNPLACEWQCHYCREDWTVKLHKLDSTCNQQ